MSYKLRRGSVHNQETYQLAVPSEVGRRIPKDLRFECELTDEGILYRPVRATTSAAPSWLTTADESKQ